jgi:hypothetical protein
MTLIDLIDKVRMLDNDLIRLHVKLDMLLQQQDKYNEKDSITHIDDSDYSDPSN